MTELGQEGCNWAQGTCQPDKGSREERQGRVARCELSGCSDGREGMGDEGKRAQLGDREKREPETGGEGGRDREGGGKDPSNILSPRFCFILLEISG